jgi:hypothetical protein
MLCVRVYISCAIIYTNVACKGTNKRLRRQAPASALCSRADKTPQAEKETDRDFALTKAYPLCLSRCCSLSVFSGCAHGHELIREGIQRRQSLIRVRTGGQQGGLYILSGTQRA